LVDITESEDGAVILSNPVNITAREGYDNQPAFTPDSKSVLYTSSRDGQTDIYEYNLISKSFTQLTNTPESEYSPGIMPDGLNISVVKVEKDSAQRLWKFPLKGGEQSVIMKDIDSVGYYTWINKDSVALFVLGAPPTLQMADIHSQKIDIISKDIGKGMQMYMPNNCLFFVSYDTTAGQRQGIYVFCYGSKSGVAYYHPLAGANDFFCVSKVGLMMGEGSIVYREFKDFESPWVTLSNLNNWGITNISRIAISPDGKKAAIVSVK
jgi:dipeptidyl aminopeptidase/acylaminoacyl peptidase